MLTPAQIKDYEFKSSGRNAYKSEDVDEFIAEITVDYEKMFRENGELVKRVSLLADRLEKYKNDENEIKNAVVSAQKAAELIVKEAEDSVKDSKDEAEAVLNAAKSEADIIKADAEKQAIADSELLLSMTRDKAQEIIQKAKEEARSIVLEAKSSAKDEMGAANRTVTSESLLYDMMKKEVSDFKANILAQYKAHIELISKLPEIAAEEAENTLKAETEAEPIDTSFVISLDDDVDSYSLTEDFSENAVEENNEENNEGNNEDNADEISEVNFEEDVTENDKDVSAVLLEVTEYEFEEDSFETEDVIKTELPFDFFAEENQIDFVDNSSEVFENNSAVLNDDLRLNESEDDSFENNDTQEKSSDFSEALNTSFSIDSSEFLFSAEDMSEDSLLDNSQNDTDGFTVSFLSESIEDEVNNDVEDTEENIVSTNEEPSRFEDIPISGGFNINTAAIESIEPDEEKVEEITAKKHGFFKRKK